MKTMTIAALLLLSTTALADPTTDGGYLSIAHVSSSEDSDGDFGLRAAFGFRANKNSSLELAYTHAILDDINDVSLKGGTVDMAFNWILPVHKRVELFAKVGYHYSWLEASFQGDDERLDWDGVLYGGGINIRPTDRVDLKVEYVVYDGPEGLDESGTYQVGMTYYFAGKATQ